MRITTFLVLTSFSILACTNIKQNKNLGNLQVSVEQRRPSLMKGSNESLAKPGKLEDDDWLSHLNELEFWERLSEIESVSELPKPSQSKKVPSLLRLLKDQDQSVRVTAAHELAEIHEVAPNAIPHIIENFAYEHGEEGASYVDAVASFGELALLQLENALQSENWLVRARACDAIRKIAPKMYVDGECRQRAP